MNHPAVSTNPAVELLLSEHAPVAIGVSGGKDSSAVAFATVAHLDSIGHKGPRILVHSDLGVTEWKESLEWCHMLAARLGLELIVVRRRKGDMMDRWEQRWNDNVARYRSLLCVQLILPWSTPGMRFCTSEMKIAPICRELSERYPGRTIVNVNGIRRQESAGRSDKPISQRQPKLTSKTRATAGIDWHPCIDWTISDVLRYLEEVKFPLHPAYLVWMLTRVSCVFCIMSAAGDLRNAARCESNHGIYRRMVRLEIASTFAFQSKDWLGDVAPELLTATEREQLLAAKSKANARREIESLIHKDLLFVKGWPVAIPTRKSAAMLCGVRREVGLLMGLDCDYLDPPKLIDRYEELFAKNQSRIASKSKRRK
jgi:3'-phosphoadenosine 5'-phosphosulfate sulfotransferase (PAPS reductase)/FAD synthetase